MMTKPDQKLTSMTQIGVTLLAGVADDGSVLAKLRGTPHIVRFIFILTTNEHRWRRCIRYHEPKEKNEKFYNNDDYDNDDKYDAACDSLYFVRLGKYHIKFPAPTDINISMMPFILANNFEDSKLPMYLKPYWSLISPISNIEYHKSMTDEGSEYNDVCFLTIHESFVDTGSTQRLPGLKVDCAGIVKFAGVSGSVRGWDGGSQGGGESWEVGCWGVGLSHFIPDKDEEREEEVEYEPDKEEVECRGGGGGGEEGDGEEEFHKGYRHQLLNGGIYMASTIDASYRTWDCKIVKDRASGGEVIGKHGNIEHLRHLLPLNRGKFLYNLFHYI